MKDLHPLLRYLADTDYLQITQDLADAPPPGPVAWQGWQIRRVTGGRNNLLFRATNGEDDLVVKFTRRDARDRATREYYALALLRARSPGLAPAPVLLDIDHYPYQVVVQRWMEGESRDEPPASAEEWQRLLEHYAAVHAITPAQVDPALQARLKPAVLTFNQASDAARFVLDDATKLPGGAYPAAFNAAESSPAEVRELLSRLAQARFPTWPEPPRTFSRCDPYIANFLRFPDGRPWASVDWENSGWGDPAFEIADVTAHPCYKTVPGAQWAGFFQACQARSPEDATFITRARAYRAIILVRWARLFAGFVQQWQRGDLDMGRLVAWPRSWWEGVPADYQHYLKAAQSALAEYS